jgi:hypothetical protein
MWRLERVTICDYARALKVFSVWQNFLNNFLFHTNGVKTAFGDVFTVQTALVLRPSCISEKVG